MNQKMSVTLIKTTKTVTRGEEGLSGGKEVCALGPSTPVGIIELYLMSASLYRQSLVDCITTLKLCKIELRPKN